MGRPASLALQLAQALCSESKDTLRDLASAREIRAQWRKTSRKGRLFWLRKARRALQRLQEIGPTPRPVNPACVLQFDAHDKDRRRTA